MKKPIVYIAHPIASYPKINISLIKGIFERLSLENKVIPFAPYLTAVEVLDDEDPEQREIGFDQNKAFFERGIIDELWVYGISQGVELEMEWAKELGIKIVMKC